MSNRPTLAVTGAAGQLGRRTVELLLGAGATNVVALTRRPDQVNDLEARGAIVRRADFDDQESVAAALAGVDRMLLVSTDAVDRPGHRFEQHQRAIDAAKKVGVKHIVYTSLSRPEKDSPVLIAGDHIATEQALAGSGLGYTVLRNNMYTDVLLMGLPKAVGMGKLFAAAGTGGAAYITREDCARGAAAALSASFDGKRTLELTGPAVVSHGELAMLATELSGRKVEYVPMEASALEAVLAQSGMPAALAKLWVSFDVGMARGYFGPATNAFRELVGAWPVSVKDFLTQHRQALAVPPPTEGTA